jgi:hypothetical protein
LYPAHEAALLILNVHAWPRAYLVLEGSLEYLECGIEFLLLAVAEGDDVAVDD